MCPSKISLLKAMKVGDSIIAIPFVCKFIEPSSKSKVFKPPNPWLMAVISLLTEVYHFAHLKLNLKFKIEKLCKDLDIDLDNVEAMTILHNKPTGNTAPPTGGLHEMLCNYCGNIHSGTGRKGLCNGTKQGGVEKSWSFNGQEAHSGSLTLVTCLTDHGFTEVSSTFSIGRHCLLTVCLSLASLLVRTAIGTPRSSTLLCHRMASQLHMRSVDIIRKYWVPEDYGGKQLTFVCSFTLVKSDPLCIKPVAHCLLFTTISVSPCYCLGSPPYNHPAFNPKCRTTMSHLLLLTLYTASPTPLPDPLCMKPTVCDTPGSLFPCF